jgi:hypothetical protein
MGGLGDTVTIAYLAEGARGSDSPIELAVNCPAKREILDCLGVPWTSDKSNAVMPTDAYNRELDDGGRLNRIDYLRQHFNIMTPPIRPRNPRTTQEAYEWAREHREKWGKPDAKTIMLFPQVAWPTRQWPKNLWVDLFWDLNNAGYAVKVFIRDDDRIYQDNTQWYIRQSFTNIAAMMNISDLVIGNDSLAVHFASALGRQSIALLGPTRKTVFGHCLDKVSCLTTDSPYVTCTGCHFKGERGMRRMCDTQCASLQSLTVGQVRKEVDRLLNPPPPEPVPVAPEPAPSIPPLAALATPAQDAKKPCGCTKGIPLPEPRR